MNDATLNLKLDALRSFPALSDESVGRFGEALRRLSAWDTLRINPFVFAEEHGFEAAEAVELFVHGAKVGLFDFVWNLICPHCGAIVMRSDSVNRIETI